MIWGTSNILLKSGPVTLLSITKILQRKQEKYGIILGKYYLCQSGTQENRKHRKMYVLGTMFFKKQI